MHGNWAEKIYSPTGFAKVDILGGAKALDVGCGARKLPGATGMDILALPGVDVVHDFNATPWPFTDNAFDLVLLNHSLEHVGNVIAVMNEVHRLLAPGGRAVVQVPYFRSTDAYGDPTHTHFFTSESLNFATRGRYRYTDKQFTEKGFWYGWPHPSANPLKQFFKSALTAQRARYDQYLSLLFPADCVTWELEVVKS